MINISRQRAALLEHLLSDEVLGYCEETYPARIRLLASTRKRATLRVGGSLVVYQLSDRLGKIGLVAETQDADAFRRDDPDLWALSFHRAAEAILAVRNGHKEHVLFLQGRKAKKQGADV